MAIIDCKNCGGKISDKAESCPHCGFDLTISEEIQEDNSPEEIIEEKILCEDCGTELEAETTVCPVCGCPVPQKEEKNAETDSAETVSEFPKKSKTKLIAIIAVVIAVLAVFIGINGSTLSGDDKIAYEIIADAAYNFKDPSSVRLVSGCLGVDKDCLFCGISAINGFGARHTEYYFIMGGMILEEENPDYLFKITDELNVDKINKKLEKELGY